MTQIEIAERQIEVNGIQLHVATAGAPDAPPLLLLHGLYDRWERWEPVIEPLARRFHLIIPDLRGHARSSKPESGYAPGNFADDFANLLEAMQIDQVAVVGHSLGGVIAIYLAEQASKRVNALVLVDPPLDWDADMAEMTQFLLDAKRGTREETEQLIGELYWHLDADERERMVTWLRDTADGPFEAIIEIAERNRGGDIYKRLQAIRCPVLLMQADPMAGASMSAPAAAYARTILSGIELVTFSDTGHAIHHEQPDAFVEQVVGFLLPDPGTD